MIIFSDIHFSDEYFDFNYPTTGMPNSRLGSQLDVLEAVFSCADRLKDKNIVFLGDWFDKWKSLSSYVYHAVTDKLYGLLAEYDMQLTLIGGNHDKLHKNRDEPQFILAYKAHPQVHLITKPTTMSVDGKLCTFIPYYEDPKIATDYIATLQKGGLLLAHLDIVGARTGIEGYSSTNGLNIGSLKKKFKMGLFGHYHLPQILDDDPNFMYVGSPMQIVRYQQGEEHGIVHLPSGEWETEFMTVPHPHFITVDATCPDFFEGVTRWNDFDYHLVNCTSDNVEAVRAEVPDYAKWQPVITREEKDTRPLQPESDTIEDEVAEYANSLPKLSLEEKQTLIEFGHYYVRG